MNITHVIVHDDEQTRSIITRALEIANEIDHAVIPPRAIFEEACKLLGQRATVAVPPVPVSPPFQLREGWAGR